MRRKDREVIDINEIEEIIKSCKTCHLAMCDGVMPYVVPLNYAYEINDGVLTLYFHSAKEGKKLEILSKNNNVCFEMCAEGEPLFAAKTPCNSGYYYSCVQGFGKVSFIEDAAGKCDALSRIMLHQADIETAFEEKHAKAVCCFKVTSDSFTGKRKKRPQTD